MSAEKTLGQKEWHGWSRAALPFTGETIHVGPLPGRKSICLYTMDYTKGAIMRVHAYFRSEDEAQHFLGALDRILISQDCGLR